MFHVDIKSTFYYFKASIFILISKDCFLKTRYCHRCIYKNKTIEMVYPYRNIFLHLLYQAYDKRHIRVALLFESLNNHFTLSEYSLFHSLPQKLNLIYIY